jgi:hypothetical protein
VDAKQEIKALIAGNDTREAINRLKQITLDTQLYNDVLQQSAKYEQYEQDKIQGVETSSTLNIALNRINQSLLLIADQLENMSSSPSDKKQLSTKEPPAVGNNKNLWVYLGAVAIVLFFLGLAESLNFINFFPNGEERVTETLTVLIHGKAGKDDIVLPNRGVVYLIYGDAKIPEQINNEGEATFKQIPSVFFARDAKVEILFEDPQGEPYRVANRDTLYDLKRASHIAVAVVLEGMDQVVGVVKDFETGAAIDSAIVRVFGKETYSNAYGEFVLDIPESQQKQFITLRAFKEGYQSWELADIPTTTDQEIIIPLKKLQ